MKTAQQGLIENLIEEFQKVVSEKGWGLIGKTNITIRYLLAISVHQVSIARTKRPRWRTEQLIRSGKWSIYTWMKAMQPAVFERKWTFSGRIKSPWNFWFFRSLAIALLESKQLLFQDPTQVRNCLWNHWPENLSS